MPFITRIYLPLIDSENGDFRHYPYGDVLMDQPACTMELLKLVQLNYRIALHEKMKKR